MRTLAFNVSVVFLTSQSTIGKVGSSSLDGESIFRLRGSVICSKVALAVMPILLFLPYAIFQGVGDRHGRSSRHGSNGLAALCAPLAECFKEVGPKVYRCKGIWQSS